MACPQTLLIKTYIISCRDKCHLCATCAYVVKIFTLTLPKGHIGLNYEYANEQQVIKVQAELFKSSLNWNKKMWRKLLQFVIAVVN